MSVSAGSRGQQGAEVFDTGRCRARIVAMQDEELDDYILRVKTRLVHSHEDSYFLEESLLIQLGEACEERRRRWHRFEAAREHRRGHSGTERASAGIGAD